MICIRFKDTLNIQKEKWQHKKTKTFILNFIYWWKEDFKQQDLMNKLGKALSVNGFISQHYFPFWDKTSIF